VRVEELINYFDFAYPRPASRDEPFRFTTALTPSPWNEGRQLLHVGVQGYAPPENALAPLNLVFLVDVSGSMQGPDRLDLAKQSLDVLIAQLRPQDRVAMAVYAGSAGQVLAPTPGTDKLRMRCAVQALEAGGSTAGGEGLALAYTLAQQNFDRNAVNRVILLTDGDFNVGVADPSKLEDFVAEKRRSGVYLSVYGFGGGNYNDALMQTIAQAGNGTAAYIDTLNESRKLLRDDFTASLFPIADDVKIQVEFNPTRVAEYRLIGYETRLLAREDFNNDAVDAGEVGAGAAVTALYELTPVGGPRAIDPLRYGREVARPAGGGELAFLKLRYKRPGGGDSRLLQQAIADAPLPLERAPESTRLAVAVAGYGQLLRGDPNLRPGYTWADVAALAEGARGADAYGLRTEFIQLARAAGSARSLNE
jgi:Ca-activated chloride channel family protein